MFLPYREFGGASPVYYNELEKAGNDKAEESVGQAETRLRSLFPEINLNITKAVVRGSPGQVVVEEAERWGADLIVVGSHGYGFWSRTLLGSVSQAIVHHAPCSVLVVRKNKK